MREAGPLEGERQRTEPGRISTRNRQSREPPHRLRGTEPEKGNRPATESQTTGGQTREGTEPEQTGGRILNRRNPNSDRPEPEPTEPGADPGPTDGQSRSRSWRL